MEDVGAVTHGLADASVLVTGARGFVGAHLCEALVEEGARVVGLVLPARRTGYFDTADLAHRVQIVEGSVSSPEDVASVFADHQFALVFHLAGRATVGDAVAGPLEALEDNVRGTYLLLDACRRLWDEGDGPLRGVSVASSHRVYGRQDAPCTEETPLLGLAPYDASKVCADVLTRSYATTYGLPAAVARHSNIYGPGDTNLSRIVPGTIVRTLRGRAAEVHSDGTPERDYVYVGDAVEAHLLLAQRASEDGVRGQAFNFGTGQPISVLGLIQEICMACDRPDLEPLVLGEPTGEADRQRVSAAKAFERLGWAARTPRSDGLAEAARWYRERGFGA